MPKQALKKLPRREDQWVDADVLGKFLYKYNYHENASSFTIVSPDYEDKRVCKSIPELLWVFVSEYGEGKALPIDTMVTKYRDKEEESEDMRNRVIFTLIGD